jgi:coproporphyrinogen III oxidase-like Fe-S oxidoreductase
LPDEEVEVQMYTFIMERLLAHGYTHYEVSNFAKPGFACQHNLTYWRNRAYLAVGAGAHGYVNGQRHFNVKPLQAYIARCEEGLPREEIYEVSREEAMEDFMMLGLRLLKGVSLDDFREQFGCDWQATFGETIERLLRQGLLLADERGYRLSARGLLLGNEVFGAFLSEPNLY